MAMKENDVPDEVSGPTHLDDYQWNRTPDVWMGALWFGAAMRVLKAVADSDLSLVVDEEDVVALARTWLERVPVEVKAAWPGTFDEYPYVGESAEDHTARRGGKEGTGWR